VKARVSSTRVHHGSLLAVGTPTTTTATPKASRKSRASCSIDKPPPSRRTQQEQSIKRHAPPSRRKPSDSLLRAVESQATASSKPSYNSNKRQAPPSRRTPSHRSSYGIDYVKAHQSSYGIDCNSETTYYKPRDSLQRCKSQATASERRTTQAKRQPPPRRRTSQATASERRTTSQATASSVVKAKRQPPSVVQDKLSDSLPAVVQAK
jgi:hypothetical protein